MGEVMIYRGYDIEEGSEDGHPVWLVYEVEGSHNSETLYVADSIDDAYNWIDKDLSAPAREYDAG